jgi:hypothetical protein
VTPIDEAASEETPHGRYVTSEGWFVLNLTDALAVRNEQKGGATYPIESREARFHDFGVNVQVIWPGEPNCYYHSENAQEGFLILSGECTLVVGSRSGSCGNGITSTVPPARATSSSAPATGLARSS